MFNFKKIHTETSTTIDNFPIKLEENQYYQDFFFYHLKIFKVKTVAFISHENKVAFVSTKYYNNKEEILTEFEELLNSGKKIYLYNMTQLYNPEKIMVRSIAI
jgi:hypothetical protein